MTRLPRLAPGQHRRADGTVVDTLKVQLPPLSKKRLKSLAVLEETTASAIVQAALFAAHPHLAPDAPEPTS